MKNSLKWIWLAEKCGYGSSEVLSLVEAFKSIEVIYGADFDAYADAGISERLAEDLCDKSLTRATHILRTCQATAVRVLCYDDADFPTSLRSLKNPPAVLYCKGKLPDLNRELCISVVGTRKMSEYGMRAAYKIAYEVASAGAVVISGMALGIDGVSSAAAIAAGGKTVAVLGCGIDVVYPREHGRLKELIEKHGAVITEYPPSTEPMGAHFPVRNRIISGLGQGTVVIDAPLGSGALITAKNAIIQGRDIYAVPSNIDSENSSGTNSLIRDGAQAVLCGNDIIKNYAFMFRDRLNIQKMKDSENFSEIDTRVLSSMGVSSRGAKKQTERKDVDKITRIEKSGEMNDRRIRAAHKNFENVKREEIKKRAVEIKTESNAASGASGDNSKAALESLSEKQRKIFDEMPLDIAVTVDYLTKTGFKLGEVISALTVLEIKGLVSSLPGALYVRK